MRWLPILSILLCGSAIAGDFRVADWGESCALIPEREIAIGSIPIQLSKPSPDYLAFEAKAYEQSLIVSYLCRDGRLFTGNYFFPFQDRDGALETFKKVYELLGAENGEPSIDNTPWQKPVGPLIEKDPLRYYVSWRNTRVWTTIHLMPEKRDEPTSKWRLFMVVAADWK